MTNQNCESEKIIGALISEYSDTLSRKEIILLLSRIKEHDRFSVSGIDSAIEDFSKNSIAKPDLINWIEDLFQLIKQEPFVDEHDFEVSRRYQWLLSSLVIAVEHLINTRSRDVFDSRCLEIVFLSERAKHYEYSSAKDLSEIASKWPELSWALFWFSIEEERNKSKKQVTEWWQAYPRHLRFDNDDFDLAVNYINSKEFLDDKLVALSLAFKVYVESGRTPARRSILKRSVKGISELEDMLFRFFNPPPLTVEQKKFRSRDRGFSRRQKQRERKNQQNRIKSQEWLRNHKHVLLDTSIAHEGKVWKATYYLIDAIKEDKSSRGTWAKSNWRYLIAEFGLEIAQSFRDGCIAYWRKFVPKIRSEGIEDPRKTPHAVIVGLSGIQMEANQDHDWEKKLSNSEAMLACRYAVNELNGFPDWLPRLHEVFPEIVENAILKEIEWEIIHYSDDEPCHYVLSDVVWQADWLKPAISKRMLDLLSIYEPKNIETSERSLKVILFSHGIDQKTFSKVAEFKIGSDISISKKALWLAAWMMLDAGKAYGALLTTLNQISDMTQANMLAMDFITTLVGEHGLGSKSQFKDYLQVEYLLKLIKLVHQYVKRSDDLKRPSGEVYSPILRDNAQRSRDNLFRLLCDIPGKNTFLALMDLYESHPDEDSREWCMISAKRRAAADSELNDWSERDITQFASEAEKHPASHRELFDLGVSRLYDLKSELEDGDHSMADIFMEIHEERKHRKYVSEWLRNRSNGKYIVPQEEELADATKPDIRFHAANIDGPVPVEIKVVDNNYSASDLLERLRNQLCNQYLRDCNAKCGIYLLMHRGEKQYWEHPETNEHLDFSSLVTLIKREAISITKIDNKVEAIEVTAIDLSKRSRRL